MNPVLIVKKVHHFWQTYYLGALPASLYYGQPASRLNIYGITGTDGKTTSNTMLYYILNAAGRRVALISTVAAFINDEAIDTGFHVTSPEPWKVQKLLKRCVDKGITDVVLEVTAHGIFQYRVAGIHFKLAGLTNITDEHLDYFRTYDQYLRTKASWLAQADQAFINADDRSYAAVTAYLDQHHTPNIQYQQTLDKADPLTAIIKNRWPEAYNHWNAQLVVSMARYLHIPDETIAQAIKTFPGVSGRMEHVTDYHGAQVIVDFAHTPNALDQALTTLRPQTKGQLIAVFGCAGQRDPHKRPAMAKMASEKADIAIFTAEDPRTEDIQVILRQMKEGVVAGQQRKIITQPDRKQAIALALSLAKTGDIIGIFGKGHEQSMCYGTTEVPWSDQKVVRELTQ
jgi:UDP-N-acetylmuramoyl-L-alanyl-D-glutamate--2,6-diaminopimelate ligase